MKPKMIVDARIIGPKMNGISRYILLMARGLARIRDNMPEGLPYDLVFLSRPGFSGAFFGFETRDIRAAFLDPCESGEILSAIRTLRVRNGMKLQTAYHSPSLSAVPFCPVPWLNTVHDLNHLQFGNLSRRLYYRFVLRPFVRGATVRMTVSEFSRAQVARWANISESSIEVVQTAIDPTFAAVLNSHESSEILEKHELKSGRFFFCLSNSKKHKNLALLAEAHGRYRDLAEKSGAEPLTLAVNVETYEGQPGVRGFGSLSQRDVHVLMSHATAFFFPSRYEGFGLPPLEAATLGTPVVLSLIPAHREAMKCFESDEAHWVEADDANGWVDAFRRAAAGEFHPPRLESRKRAMEQFSYQRLGENIDRIYCKTLGV